MNNGMRKLLAFALSFLLMLSILPTTALLAANETEIIPVEEYAAAPEDHAASETDCSETDEQDLTVVTLSDDSQIRDPEEVPSDEPLREEPEEIRNEVVIPYGNGSVSVCPMFQNADDVDRCWGIVDDYLPDEEEHNLDCLYYLGAVINDEDGNATDEFAPAEFFEGIENVSVSLQNGSGAWDELNVSVPEKISSVVNGADLYGFRVTSPMNVTFRTDVIISFDYGGETYRVSVGAAMQEAHWKQLDLDGHTYYVGLCYSEACDNDNYSFVQAFDGEEPSARLIVMEELEGECQPVTDSDVLSMLVIENVDLYTWDGQEPGSPAVEGMDISWTASEPFRGSLNVSFLFGEYGESIRAKASCREDELDDGPSGPSAYMTVTVDEQEYTIGFFHEEIGPEGTQYILDSGFYQEYFPSDTENWSVSTQLMIVSGFVYEDWYGYAPALAPADVWAKLENPAVIMPCFNGPEPANTCETVTLEEGIECLQFSWEAVCGETFSGQLVPKFFFDGEYCEGWFTASVTYESAVKLSFMREGEDWWSDQIRLTVSDDGGDELTGEPVTGSLAFFNGETMDDGQRLYFVIESPEEITVNGPVNVSFEDGKITVLPVDLGVFSISYNAPDGNTYSITGSVELQDWNWNWCVEVPYEDEVITVGMAGFEFDCFSLIPRLGDSYSDDNPAGLTGAGYSQNPIYLMGIRDLYQPNESPAPAEFMDGISNVRIRIAFTDDPANYGNASLTPIQQYTGFAGHEGLTVNGLTIQTERGKPFDANLLVSFDYAEQHYSFTMSFFFHESNDRTVDASDLDTAEMLNAVLASKDALADYLQEKGVSFAWYEATLRLMLPAVTYEDVIVVDVSEPGHGGFYGIEICGDPDGGTVMKGLRMRSALGFLRNIRFVADPEVTQTFDGETFTCGVLYDGNPAKEPRDWSSSANDCIFENFDYGVYANSKGFSGGLGGCTFINCKRALVIACAGLPDWSIGSTFSENKFINSTVAAITVTGLPDNLSNYRFRIKDNCFISDNGAPDFVVSLPGYLFFYLNYFGTEDGQMRSPVLEEAAGSYVAVNPCRRSADLSDDLFWMDPSRGARNWILNNEAHSMPIDPASLNGVTFSVINEDEPEEGQTEGTVTVLGTYSFGGGDAG